MFWEGVQQKPTKVVLFVQSTKQAESSFGYPEVQKILAEMIKSQELMLEPGGWKAALGG